jgi:hypothetical protein
VLIAAKMCLTLLKRPERFAHGAQDTSCENASINYRRVLKRERFRAL